MDGANTLPTTVQCHDEPSRTNDALPLSAGAPGTTATAQPLKACSQCKEEKAVSEFHRNKWMKDGLTAGCKPCRKLSDKRLCHDFSTPGTCGRAGCRGTFKRRAGGRRLFCSTACFKAERREQRRRPYVARTATDWVVALKQEAPPNTCVMCQTEPIPAGRRVMCARPQCRRDYMAEYKREQRAKGLAR